jgi:SAM-dependent methyltransferase
MPLLDVACGKGRHARYFLERGYSVTAVDVDLSGMGDLEGHEGLTLIEADLECGDPWPLGDQRFGAVIVSNYLHRPLFPHLLNAMDDGSVLIYDTFAVGNEAYGKPSRLDFLLEPDELLHLVEGKLEVIDFEQGYVEEPKPAIKQRIAAVKNS